MGFCLVKGKKTIEERGNPSLAKNDFYIYYTYNIFTYFASLSFWDFDLAKFGIRARSPQ